ncbi:MAG TPA: type II toxin-antitoxin system prevent-host-death family antitoxin [Candidatus Micrarchaeaceae archaeon]|nr:type II toxin-antitoxin system prevent-host-death family antitoxin [Candidatus Micrarchaeaceae archaeon]HVB14508.1 type II toxin-antitoxin system prevent-host-death family antitoxin [Candidatus Dormibacteraeota bacterium]
MTRIGVRELRQHASRYLDEVKRGGRIEVTERGQLVALLVSPSPAQTARDRLLELGGLLPASQPFSLPQPRSLAPDGLTASQALQELRAERRP